MTGVVDDIPRFVSEPPLSVREADGSETIRARFCFGEDFVGFRGHFPGQPVLPGIVQIMLAQYTASLGRRSRLLEVVKCKFTSHIEPGYRVEVQTQAVANKPGRFKATVLANDERAATLVFQLADADPQP